MPSIITGEDDTMTSLVRGSAIAAQAMGMISEKKQLGTHSIDLTVQSISRVESGGSLDFGGSEFSGAITVELQPVKKKTDEEYGWWQLPGGVYLIKFNETIAAPGGGLVIILPHERLVAAGSAHAAIAVEMLDGDVSILMEVSMAGLSIKENARISKALVFAG